MSEETRLAQPPAVTPPAEPNLDEVIGKVEKLAAAVAAKEERTAVQGMGSAPSDAAAHSYLSARSSLEPFRPVVDWLFGVQGAALPDPQFRRADMIYWTLTGDFEMRGKFDRERVMLSGATTATLPGMAVDAMNKVIAAQFSALTH